MELVVIVEFGHHGKRLRPDGGQLHQIPLRSGKTQADHLERADAKDANRERPLMMSA